jgi:hypothetical protein
MRNIINIPVEIPEEYEIFGEQVSHRNPNGDLITIYFQAKKKKEKDFNWYIEAYVKQNTMSYNDLHYLESKQYNKVSFNSRIELFNFICNDGSIGIFPKEFMNSIIRDLME